MRLRLVLIALMSSLVTVGSAEAAPCNGGDYWIPVDQPPITGGIGVNLGPQYDAEACVRLTMNGSNVIRERIYADYHIDPGRSGFRYEVQVCHLSTCVGPIPIGAQQDCGLLGCTCPFAGACWGGGTSIYPYPPQEIGPTGLETTYLRPSPTMTSDTDCVSSVCFEARRYDSGHAGLWFNGQVVWVPVCVVVPRPTTDLYCSYIN